MANDNADSPLELISFAASHITRSINGQLLQLNYSLVPRSAANWLGGRGRYARAFVLVLDTPVPRTVECLLTKETCPPFLAIFCGPKCEWNNGIAARSQGFCGWPCEKEELALRLQHLLSQKSARRSARSTEISDCSWFDLNLIGDCPEFLKIKSLIRKTAQCHAPVLIEGETGTGKEVTARAIHYLGDRQQYPFIPINCGALPDNLVENELFGHERGAYTDAKQRQIGLVAQADRGTLFLDEIEALSPKGQVILLRFLEDQRYKPLGGQDTSQVDVRLIAATNTPLTRLVRNGSFREDLLFRLNVLTIQLPPLRTRPCDIGLLAQHFLRRFQALYKNFDTRFHPDTIACMEQHQWPGNIREFENYIHRALLLTDGELILPPDDDANSSMFTNEHAMQHNGQRLNLDQSLTEAKQKMIHQFEHDFLCRLLEETHGNVTQAAKLAGKERRSFGKLLKKYGIDKSRFISDAEGIGWPPHQC